MDQAAIRKKLIRWYEQQHRDLPWRKTKDPYAIWVSEIMLQQTRVAAVIPYYQRFLERFPAVEHLAAAPESDVLALWSGLGYYSRARNLQKAALQIAKLGAFPRDYELIRELAGIGDYTASAVASIAFGSPHAAVDGNVRRVVMRLANDPNVDVAEGANALLDRRDPGRWNQAMMELGATICVPRNPQCVRCPVSKHCDAYHAGTVAALPPPKQKSIVRSDRTLLIIRKEGRLLFVPSSRVAGFWDFPEPFTGAKLGAQIGRFRHAITNTQYMFEVREAKAKEVPAKSRWIDQKLGEILLSTISKKALRCLERRA